MTLGCCELIRLVCDELTSADATARTAASTEARVRAFDSALFWPRTVECVLSCFVKWSDRINFLPHWAQAKRFSPKDHFWKSNTLFQVINQLLTYLGMSQKITNNDKPVCVLRCLCNSSERVNLFWQCAQSHAKGFCPACPLRCARKWDVFPYVFSQRWQMCKRCFSPLFTLQE